MRILFCNETDFEFGQDKVRLIENVIQKSLEYERFTLNSEISVTVVTNEEIKKINKRYRNIDRETDVLSFPIIDFENEEIPNGETETVILGDIIISIEKAISQAEQYGHSIERELGFLTAHSMLHLIGYDHIKEEEEKIMFFKQEEILKSIGLVR